MQWTGVRGSSGEARACALLVGVVLCAQVAFGQMVGEPVDEPATPRMDTGSPGGAATGMDEASGERTTVESVSGDAEGAADLFSALSGPVVRERIGRSIVRHDARGEFRRVSGLPEESAIGVLDLDDQAREYCRAAFAERRLAMGVLLADHLDESFAYGDSIEKRERELTSELTTFFRDRWELSRSPSTVSARSELPAVLAAVLSPEQYVELERMLNEYWQAWIAWELRTRRNVTEADCERTRARLERTVFSEELRRAYDDQIKPYKEKLEKLHEAVDPTPEQRAAIRAALAEFLRDSRLRPRAEQRRELMGRFYRVLDDDRRAKFFELVAAETAGGTW